MKSIPSMNWKNKFKKNHLVDSTIWVQKINAIASINSQRKTIEGV